MDVLNRANTKQRTEFGGSLFDPATRSSKTRDVCLRAR
jgi:hypothetical protein